MLPQSSLQSNHNLNFIGDSYQPLWADKTRTSEVLNSIGLNFSDLVRLTLIKLVHERKLPFEVEFFKDETIEAIRMVEKEEVTRHESVGAYFENRGT